MLIMNLKELLTRTVEEKASDLHITAGSPPRIRKGGKLIPISDEKLSVDDTKKIIESFMTVIYRLTLEDAVTKMINSIDGIFTPD